MKSYREIRELAWNRLWSGQWFWRLFGSVLLLFFCGQVISAFVQVMLDTLGVITPLALLKQALTARQFVLPDLPEGAMFQLVTSGILLCFLVILLSGLSAYGFAAVKLRCADDNAVGWIPEAFGGYRRPFGAMALSLLVGLAITFGTLLMVVPGILAFYRYRYAWFIKVENPDWSAPRCMGESARLVEGRKRRMFGLDCSYWGIVTVALGLVLLGQIVFPLVIVIDSLAVKILSVLVVLLASWTAIPVMIVAVYYVAIGQALLYREMTLERRAATAALQT